MELAKTPVQKKRKGVRATSPSKKTRPPGNKAKATDKKEKTRVPKKSKSKDIRTVSNSSFLARRVTRHCSNWGAAAKIFQAIRRSMGQQDAMHNFTQVEIEEAWFECQDYFKHPDLGNQDELLMSSDGDETSSGSESAPESSALRKSKQMVSSKRLKKDTQLLESLLAESEEEQDLSGEESVDEELDGPFELLEEWPAPEDIVEVDDGYPVEAWAEEHPGLLPGEPGFNQRCTAVMRKLGVASTLHTQLLDSPGACPPLQPHQESVAFLLHPKSPVTRLLVDHPTGSGKTWELIRVLDNFFHDPRPKVPIFPTSPVCRNFYAELLRWPSRYRDYWCCVSPANAALASGTCDWREVRMAMWKLSHFLEEEVRFLCYSLRDVLEMKNMFYMGRFRPGLREQFAEQNPGEAMPAGPMRALGYTSAGGSFTRLRSEGDMPISAMMKIGYTRGCNNVYTNKVVVMDEAHNLVRTNTMYAEQLEVLRDLLVSAKNLVLAGFTGTPILNNPAEGRQLLDIIKGRHAPAGDEGYMSSFPMRPQKLFPVSIPQGIPDAVLTQQLQRKLVVNVQLRGESLRIYDKKRRLGMSNRVLSAYCNISSFFGTFHEGRYGSKERMLRLPAECCPKLHAIVMEVATCEEKSVIMVSRQTGYSVVLELLRQMASVGSSTFGVATMDELSEFNHVSNLRGEKYRVLVADAVICSEGVSFLAVRRVFLADVPSSPSQFIQQCGRSIRMFGHQGLPEEEQTVTNKLFVARFPKWMRSSLATWVFRMFRHVKDGSAEEHSKKMLAKFRELGIQSLEDLKARIDAHGALKRTTLRRPDSPTKEFLNQNEIVVFLDMIGLWHEEPSAVPKKSVHTTTKKPGFSTFAEQSKSVRFAALAAGSARLAALTSRAGGLHGASKKTISSEKLTNFKAVVKAASSNFSEASVAHKAVTEAMAVVRKCSEQIDTLVPRATWQAALEEGLAPVRDNECVAAAFKAIAPDAFKSDDSSLEQLTVADIKKSLFQLSKAEASTSLASSLFSMRELCDKVEALPEIDEDMKTKVDEFVRALLPRAVMVSALKQVAPDLYAARDTGGLRNLGLEQLRATRDVLERQKNNDKMARVLSPNQLVKSFNALYSAESMEEFTTTLGVKTSDEEAVVRLANAIDEFAPALEELRQKAIDCELFACLKVSMRKLSLRMRKSSCPEDPEHDGKAEVSEDELEDVEAYADNEPKPVALPEGWKLEWVNQIRGKALEQFRFVDPDGRKYYSVAELRVAISSGHAAVEDMRRARHEARLEAATEASQRSKGRTPNQGSRKKAKW
jgi:superfamily II DNA or RNA helicase